MTELRATVPAQIEREQMDGIIAAAGVDGAADIMDAFWRSTDTLVSLIHDQLSAQDLSEAAKTAHALKGSASNVGALSLSEFALDFETRCRAGDISGAREIANRFQQCVAETRSAFAPLFEKR